MRQIIDKIKPITNKVAKFIDRKFTFKKDNESGNMSITLKIGLAFMVIIILFGGSSLMVFKQAKNVQRDMESLTIKENQKSVITQLTDIFRSKNVEVANYILQDQHTSKQEYESLVDKFASTAEEVEVLIDDDTIETLFESLVYYNERMDLVFFTEIVPLMEEGDDQNAIRNMAKTNNITTSAITSTEQLIRIMNEDSNKIMNQTVQSQEQSMKFITLLLIVSIIVGIVVTIVLSRNIKMNLKQVINIANKIAKGHLRKQNTTKFRKDELGKVQHSIDLMREQIRVVIQDITSVSQVVQTSSEQLLVVSDEVKDETSQMSSTMQELAAGSETQVSSTENLSQFMAELTKKIEGTNEESQVIYSISKDAITLTDAGYNYMNQSVEKMDEIYTSVHHAVDKVENLNVQTKEISGLITIIEDIASQTNLLSLNATIEAARAGEHGRGFSVVASEVGKLAQRVAQSSADITKIVNEIQTESMEVTKTLKISYQQVQEGAEQIKITGSSFSDIQKNFNEMEQRIQDVITNITEVNEESHGLESAIQTITAVSIQSAAGAEDTSLSIQETHARMESLTESANELKRNSEHLNRVIGQFEI